MEQAQLMRLMRLHLAFAVLALVHHAPRQGQPKQTKDDTAHIGPRQNTDGAKPHPAEV